MIEARGNGVQIGREANREIEIMLLVHRYRVVDHTGEGACDHRFPVGSGDIIAIEIVVIWGGGLGAAEAAGQLDIAVPLYLHIDGGIISFWRG